jgi:hypothetical protein
MRSENPVLGRKILDLKQQFLIHEPRDVREQTGHLATLHTACIFSGPDSKELSSSLTIRGPSESGIPSLSLCTANASGNRDDGYDSQGTSQMVTKGRHGRAGRVRRTIVWAHDGVIAGPTASSSRSRFCRCNTARNLCRADHCRAMCAEMLEPEQSASGFFTFTTP